VRKTLLVRGVYRVDAAKKESVLFSRKVLLNMIQDVEDEIALAICWFLVITFCLQEVEKPHIALRAIQTSLQT
jgi:hypothetical protein